MKYIEEAKQRLESILVTELKMIYGDEWEKFTHKQFIKLIELELNGLKEEVLKKIPNKRPTFPKALSERMEGFESGYNQAIDDFLNNLK